MSKILLTGATGYVGGTVLSQLLGSTEPSISQLNVDLLVRNVSQAEKLKETYGSRVNTIQWLGLQDIAFVEDTAANYDIIINTGCGFIASGALAFVRGLSRRLKAGHPTPWIFNISGCTNLADRPLTQPKDTVPPREWDDEKDATEILDFMKLLEGEEPYSQRTTEVGVLTAAAASGVQAISVNAPCIFGEGTGLFNRQGLVVPLIMQYVLRHGHGFKLNDTANFDWVHVFDLADLYVLLVRTILERSDRGVGYLPVNQQGVVFSAVGHTLMTEINQRCLDTAFEDGILPRKDTTKIKEIRLVSLSEIADELTAGRRDVAERGWAGHKATHAKRARALLGWEPKRLQESWKNEFQHALEIIKQGQENNTIENCIG